MGWLGIGLFVVGFVGLFIQVQSSFREQEAFGLWSSIFFIIVFSILVGINIDIEMRNKFADSQTIQFVPDTLVVTGYVLEVDTLKIGE